MSHGVRSAIAIREAVRRGELPPVTTGWVHPFDWVDIIRLLVPWRRRVDVAHRPGVAEADQGPGPVHRLNPDPEDGTP